VTVTEAVVVPVLVIATLQRKSALCASSGSHADCPADSRLESTSWPS
jgi:hypothetical protein